MTENKSSIWKTPSNSHLLTKSPLLTNVTNTSRLTHLQPNTSLKLKRSQSFQNTPSKCSTPKFILKNEFEFLNLLYDEGSLNDSQMEMGDSNDEPEKHIKSLQFSRIISDDFKQ